MSGQVRSRGSKSASAKVYDDPPGVLDVRSSTTFKAEMTPMNPDFMAARSTFHREVTEIADMSEWTLDELLNLLARNNGVIGPLPPDSRFARLEAGEADRIEHINKRLFHQKIDA